MTQALALPTHADAGTDLKPLWRAIHAQQGQLIREVLYRDLARMLDTFPGLIGLYLCPDSQRAFTSAVKGHWAAEQARDEATLERFDDAMSDLKSRIWSAAHEGLIYESLRAPTPPDVRPGWGYVAGPGAAFLAQMAPDLMAYDRAQTRQQTLHERPASAHPKARRRS